MSMADKNPSDFTAFYIHHSGWLKGWLCRQLNCRETAADLLQETFIRVLLRQRQQVSIREPKAYLTQIARGLVISHWRRQDIEQAYREALTHLPEPVAPSPEVTEQLLETLCLLDQALSKLPTPVQQAFLMAQLDHLTYRDIAQQLNVAEVTIKRYVKRALVQCMLVMDQNT